MRPAIDRAAVLLKHRTDNVVTTQLGDILASTISEQGGFVKLWTPALFVKLVAVTAISAGAFTASDLACHDEVMPRAAPVLLKSRLQAWLSPSIASTSTGRALPLPATGSPPLGTFNGQRRRLASVDADYFAVPNASTEYIPLS